MTQSAEHKQPIPDGPRLTPERIATWEQHIAERVGRGMWQMAVDDLREWLRICERQRRFRVDWRRVWPSDCGVDLVPGDDILGPLVRRVGILLGYGLWSHAARAIADTAAMVQAEADEHARRASLVAIHGHLPPEEIPLADVISDPKTLCRLEDAGITTTSELVMTRQCDLAELGIIRMRLEWLIADLDREHLRHRLSGQTLPTP